MFRIALLGLLVAPLVAFGAPPPKAKAAPPKAAVPAPGAATSKTAPAAAPAAAAPAAPAAKTAYLRTNTDFPLGPMPAGAKVGWAHAPYQDGDCSLCHERKDPKDPGKLFAPVNEVCLSCHEEFNAVLSRSHIHKPTKKACSNCHNAHNAPEKRLLHAAVPALCESCHDETLNTIAAAKVKHGAVERDRKCLNCHNPHGSSYERLLVKAPFDLCVTCHGEDGVKDHADKVLTNIGKLVKENPVLHKPVAEKDCSACHSPHSSPNFRLLAEPYPAEFYSEFDLTKYALCFQCHKSDVITTKETTTLTRFRDGSRNLHYVHVNVVGGRGRTCRACHEVHAAKQVHNIRESVPFGPRGFLLKTNYQALPNGGQCDKTCHAAKSYVNRLPGQKEPMVESLKSSGTAASAENKKDEAQPKVATPESKVATQTDPKKAPEKKK